MKTTYYDIIFEQAFGPTQSKMFTNKEEAEAFVKELEDLGFTVSFGTIVM